MPYSFVLTGHVELPRHNPGRVVHAEQLKFMKTSKFIKTLVNLKKKNLFNAIKCTLSINKVNLTGGRCCIENINKSALSTIFILCTGQKIFRKHTN